MIQENWKGVPVYSIENEHIKASYCAEHGGNVCRVWDKKTKREVLRVPDESYPFPEPPFRYGTPILMPPCKMRHGHFQFNNKDYQLPVNTPEGHNNHGLIRELPWNVISGDDHSITAELWITQFPEVYKLYPHELRLTMRCRLDEATVIQTISVENAGDTPAPFGLGLHTWFALDGEPEKWSLQLPISEMWQFDDEGVTIGTPIPLQSEQQKLLSGLNLDGVNMDMPFQIGDQPRVAVLRKQDYEIHYRISELYQQWVVYTRGPADQLICIEPYTCVGNAPNLDREISGFKIIQPQETIKLETQLTIRIN